MKNKPATKSTKTLSDKDKLFIKESTKELQTLNDRLKKLEDIAQDFEEFPEMETLYFVEEVEQEDKDFMKNFKLTYKEDKTATNRAIRKADSFIAKFTTALNKVKKSRNKNQS